MFGQSPPRLSTSSSVHPEIKPDAIIISVTSKSAFFITASKSLRHLETGPQKA
jgi:hypothetical protein